MSAPPSHSLTDTAPPPPQAADLNPMLPPHTGKDPTMQPIDVKHKGEGNPAQLRVLEKSDDEDHDHDQVLAVETVGNSHSSSSSLSISEAQFNDLHEQLVLTQNVLLDKLRDTWNRSKTSAEEIGRRLVDLHHGLVRDFDMFSSEIVDISNSRQLAQVSHGVSSHPSYNYGNNGSGQSGPANNGTNVAGTAPSSTHVADDESLSTQAKHLLQSAPMVPPPIHQSADAIEEEFVAAKTEMHVPVYDRDIDVGRYRFVVRNTDRRPRQPAHFTCTLRSQGGEMLQECARHTIMPDMEFALEFSIGIDDAPAFFEFHTTNKTHIAAQLDREEEERGLLTSETHESCVFILAIGFFYDVTSGLMYDAIEEDVFYYNLCTDVDEFLEAHRGMTYIRYQREDLPRGTYAHLLKRSAPAEDEYTDPSGQTIFYIKHADSADFLYREGPGTKTYIDNQHYLVVGEGGDESVLDMIPTLEAQGYQVAGRVSRRSQEYIDYVVADDGRTTVSWRRLLEQQTPPPNTTHPARSTHTTPTHRAELSTHSDFLEAALYPENHPCERLFEVEPFHIV